MKKLKFNDGAYDDAVNTLAESLIAMVQEDNEDLYHDMHDKHIRDHMVSDIEDYTADMLVDLQARINDRIKKLFR